MGSWSGEATQNSSAAGFFAAVFDGLKRDDMIHCDPAIVVIFVKDDDFFALGTDERKIGVIDAECIAVSGLYEKWLKRLFPQHLSELQSGHI